MNSNPYKSPDTVSNSPTVSQPSTHGRAIVIALVQQVLLLLVAASMLDGGRLLRACAGALVVSWAISLLVMIYWRDHPTSLSMAIIKYGFWFVIALLLFLGPIAGLPAFPI